MTSSAPHGSTATAPKERDVRPHRAGADGRPVCSVRRGELRILTPEEFEKARRTELVCFGCVRRSR